MKSIAYSIKNWSRLLFISLIFSSNYVLADNPLVTHIYTADPTARVFNNVLYIYPSHDIQESDGLSGKNGFMMGDYHVFSTTDLINYTDHGVILDQKDVDWVDNDSYAMWAPDCNTKNGKYYFYFPGDFKIGVAVADDPVGPYIPVQQPIEHANGIDPCMFIDDDGTPYLYFGGGENLKVMRMKEDMITPDMNPITVTSLQTQYKEGSFMFKRNGTYYFTYPVDLHGTEEIYYATGDNPLGPFTQKGTIMDRWTDCWTNHHSIVEYQNQWYIFYHHEDLSSDKTLRSMCADKLFFNADGSIQKVTPTLRGIGIRKAWENIQVDRYSDKSNVEVNVLSDNEPAGFKTEQIRNNGWIKYNDVDFASENYSKVLVRAASNTSGGQIEIRLGSNSGQLLSTIDVPNTGGLSSWQTLSASINTQPTGINNLVCVFKGSDNIMVLNWVQFVKQNSIIISKNGTGNGIIKMNNSVVCDESNMTKTLPFSASESYNFTIETLVNHEFVGWQLNGAAVDEITDIENGDEIVAICNYSPPLRLATSTIEAEDFDVQSGIKAENCNEGGQNIGYIENDDYIKFSQIDFGVGVSEISVRVASDASGGNISLYIDSRGGSPVCTIPISNTNGWQTWVTLTNTINNISGVHDIFLEFTGSGGYLFNLNWISFKEAETSAVNQNMDTQVNVYPNPANSVLYINNLHAPAKYDIYNTAGNKLKSGNVINFYGINTSELEDGLYIIQITIGHKKQNIKFNVDKSI
ncbi:carbohydrate-binding protein [Labilibacter marinus]|uniref:carbohydrate-binding protein n=1 Tax=Labilibacter marinus TaxID=1477105 RepID=UPI00094F96DD|nr:carbohydrate-binding protein [Labilibacter marinus]